MTSLQAFFSSIHDGWIWALCTTGAGMYIFLRGFRVLQRKRLIQSTPASRIRSASIGLVEISGLAAGPRAIQSPITGIPCYYYRATAWQQKSSSRSRDWKKVADETLNVPFYLEDNTGIVLVNPQGAELDLKRGFRQEFNLSILSGALNLPGNIAGFVTRHGIALDNKLRIEEYCIKPKDALFILGSLAPNPDADLTTPLRSVVRSPASLSGASLHSSPSAPQKMRDPAPEAMMAPAVPEIVRLHDAGRPASLAAMSQQEKIAAALSRAGITNPAAWAAAEEQYPGVSARAPLAAGATFASGPAAAAPALDVNFDLRPKTMLTKGRNNSAFFISWRSPRQIVRALGWKSTLMIWGGPALILLSLYVMFIH